jgi:outer membrane lipoprotein-sorting protein
MRARFLLVATTILVSSSVHAENVDEIVARYVAARGGREALAAIRTLRMTGRMLAGPGREAIVRREVARPGRIRTEFEFQGTTGVYVWDGSKGSRVSPLDGSLEPEPLSDEAAALSAEQADIDGPLVDWQAKGHKVDLVEATTLPGGAAHELKVALKAGGERRLWIDDATGFLVRSASTRKVRGHDLQIETTYGDYRKTDGVAFARSIETGVAGRPQRLKIIVDDVETNPALDDARFRLPR